MTAPPAVNLLRGSGLDSANGSEFIQERIALYAKITAITSFVFFLVGRVVLATLHDGPLRFTQQGLIAHVIGVAFAAGTWLICSYGRHRLAVLEAIDAVGLIGTCSCWGFLIVQPRLEWIYTSLIAVPLTVLARAITVPSRPGRTLRLSFAAYLAQLGNIWFWVLHPIERPMPLAMAIELTVWGLAVVAIATLTSRVLYQLRRSVREANELGQYLLEEKLGTGGMGEVWKARHRFLVRAAAVKLIRPELLAAGKLDPEVTLRRFEREARATAALRSPHTVQLYDYGQSDDGTLFYVMEMLGGIDLENLVARYGPVPAERAIHLLRQICDSLYEAHQNGLIHRDVKPANVFASCIGTETDFVKVLDFGLVSLQADRPNSDVAKLTADGSLAGTPAYTAPEVVLGEGGFDHRVDIYALGCVGYWLLTGKLVFEGETSMKIMLAHAHDTPAWPHERTELPIPVALEQIIMDCLEKDPARRPQTAAALAARLREVETPQEWTPERAERWWRAHLPQEVTDRSVADALLSREIAPVELRAFRPRRIADR